MPFAYTKKNPEDGVVHLTVSGEVDVSVSSALRCLILNAITNEPIIGLVVDLDQLTFLDCTGISALIAGRRYARQHDITYQVINPHDRVRLILEIAGVLKDLTKP